MSHSSTHNAPARSGLALPAILALAATVGLDVLRYPRSAPAEFLASVVGLSISFGLVLALLLDGLLRRLPRIPVLGRILPYVVGLLVGGSLADALGVFTRLAGRHQRLAVMTLLVCLAGGTGLGMLLSGLQDRLDGRPGPLMRLRGAAHIALVFGLLNGGLVALGADHNMYVGLYPVAHVSLRVAACLLLTLALHVWRPWAKLGEASVPLFVLSLFVPTALLTRGADDALQAFSLRPFSSTLLHGARHALDFDRDGFSALMGGGDCDDDNPKVHPAAREIPDNGIDDNCFFGDASKQVVSIEALPKPKGKSPVNVVLITVDTLRWDRLGLNEGAYAEAGKNTMPNTSAWGRKGLNFTRAYTAGSWTSIALASLTRGLYARRLEWLPHYETNRFRMLVPSMLDTLRSDERVEKMFPLAWQDPHPPLSALLQRRGMHTVATIDDSFSLMLARELGCDEGFDIFREVNRGASVRPRFDDVDTARMAVREIEKAANGKAPFFLWVHFFGPHGPSTIHKEVRLDSRSESDLYDNEVRFVDVQLKKVFDALTPMLDDTAVFLTADHGENIAPNYRSHGTSAQENMIRVPMLARVPGWPSGEYTHAVSHVDLVPTVLGLTRTPAPGGLDGIDLTPIVTGKRPAPHRVLLTDCWGFDKNARPFVDLVAAYDGHHKLIMDRRDNGFSRFSQTGMEDEASVNADLLAGPLMNTLMGYVEETGGAIHMEVSSSTPPKSEPKGAAKAGKAAGPSGKGGAAADKKAPQTPKKPAKRKPATKRALERPAAGQAPASSPKARPLPTPAKPLPLPPARLISPRPVTHADAGTATKGASTAAKPGIGRSLLPSTPDGRAQR